MNKETLERFATIALLHTSNLLDQNEKISMIEFSDRIAAATTEENAEKFRIYSKFFRMFKKGSIRRRRCEHDITVKFS